MNNKTIADKETRRERLRECFKCPHLKQPKNRCGKCGCFMSVKVLLQSAKCPVGKW